MIAIQLHDPERAAVTAFASRGKLCGCVDIFAGCAVPVSIFTTPEKAKRIAAIINEGDAE